MRARIKAAGCCCATVLFQAFAQPCQLGGPSVPLIEIPEASGIAISRRSPGLLWSHNDSGEPLIFGFDAKGTIKARIRVTNAEIDDWEDLAVGPCPKGSCLYIGDIGDNRGLRKQVTIYRIPEPKAGDTSSEPAELFHATYPDGPHDAEALFVTPQMDLFVVTKSQRAMYRFPKPLQPGATVVLERVTTPDLGGDAAPQKQKKGAREGRVTGAAASPDGQWAGLRTNLSLLLYKTPELLSGKAPAFRFDLGPLQERQGEGVALGEQGAVYLTGEGGSKAKPGSLVRITCAGTSR